MVQQSPVGEGSMDEYTVSAGCAASRDMLKTCRIVGRCLAGRFTYSANIIVQTSKSSAATIPISLTIKRMTSLVQ